MRAALGPRLRGELGLGACLACLGELMVDERDESAVDFAVTLAPMLWPPGARDGVPVAVPACWEHVQRAARSRSLMVPPGPGKIRPRGRG